MTTAMRAESTGSTVLRGVCRLAIGVGLASLLAFIACRHQSGSMLARPLLDTNPTPRNLRAGVLSATSEPEVDTDPDGIDQDFAAEEVLESRRLMKDADRDKVCFSPKNQANYFARNPWNADASESSTLSNR